MDDNSELRDFPHVIESMLSTRIHNYLSHHGMIRRIRRDREDCLGLDVSGRGIGIDLIFRCLSKN